MGRTLVGEEKIQFDYIIEVDGYERPLLLLEFSLNASMTMRYKTSGKSSRWNHLTDTRRCTIWYEKDFNREVKISTIFGGDRPLIRIRDGLALPILSAGLDVTLDNMAEEFGAWLTNIFEKGHCGSSKGRRRRRKALKTYRKAFKKAINESVSQIVNLLGKEASKEIQNQLRDNIGQKLIVKKVVPRAIPDHKNVSNKIIAEQIHESITGAKPTEEELKDLLQQSNIRDMTRISSNKQIQDFLEKLKQIKELFEPINFHANNVANLIKSGGERKAPDFPEDDVIFGEDPKLRETRRFFFNLFNSPTCKNGIMSGLYFPDNYDLSKQISNEFDAYNKIRITIINWIEEGRNLTRLLNVLYQDPSELENLIEEIEDNLEESSEAVSIYVGFQKRVRNCMSLSENLKRYKQNPELRLQDLLDAIKIKSELVYPIPIDEIKAPDKKLLEDFDDYLHDDWEVDEHNEVNLQEFLKFLPPLKELDINKRDIIKNEIRIIKFNQFYDLSIRNSAHQIELNLDSAIEDNQLENVDKQILNLGEKISNTNL